MSREQKLVTLANGLEIAYVEQGPANGTPVLLLHGFSDSHRSFDLLRPHLPAAWRVTAPSLRGHGDSEKPEACYRITDFADDVPQLMDALGVDRAMIVGHSLGAAIALQAAADHRARVAGLVLIAAFADFRTSAAVAELEAECAKLTDPVDPAFARGFQESTIANSLPPGFLDTAVNESAKLPAHVWAQTAQGMRRADLPDAAQRSRAPVLLIWGDKDQYCTHADQLALRARCGSARLAVFAGYGHATHWEAPAPVAQRIVAFVSELDCVQSAA